MCKNKKEIQLSFYLQMICVIVIMDSKILKLYSWVLAGSQRMAILKSLKNPKTPKIIQIETKFNFGNISNVLKLMQDKGLIQCLNPEVHIGRIYQLTSTGNKVLEEIEKLESQNNLF